MVLPCSAVQVKDGNVGVFLYRDPTIHLLQVKTNIYLKNVNTGEWVLRAELLLHFSKKDGDAAWGSKTIIPTTDSSFIKDEKVDVKLSLQLWD